LPRLNLKKYAPSPVPVQRIKTNSKPTPMFIV